MFNIFFAALKSAIGIFLEFGIVKGLTITVVFVLLTSFSPFVLDLLPDEIALTTLFQSLDSTFWYFVEPFKIDVGLNVVLSAIVTRFIIRRIPFFG